jgi:hypothetical protein
VSFTFRCALIFVDTYARTLFLEVNSIFQQHYMIVILSTECSQSKTNNNVGSDDISLDDHLPVLHPGSGSLETFLSPLANSLLRFHEAPTILTI